MECEMLTSLPLSLSHSFGQKEQGRLSLGLPKLFLNSKGVALTDFLCAFSVNGLTGPVVEPRAASEELPRAWQCLVF